MQSSVIDICCLRADLADAANQWCHVNRCAGVLNLIDLAGSERLSKSLAQGERLKETQAINKSLSALGTCLLTSAITVNVVQKEKGKGKTYIIRHRFYLMT